MDPTITLTLRDEWWVATDEATGVTGRGRTQNAALDNLNEALDEAGTEAVFEAIGVYPDPDPGDTDE